MSYFFFDLFYSQIECLTNFSHIDDLIRSNVLNQSLSSDVLHQCLHSAHKEQVKPHLLPNLNDLSLELHVAAVQKVLDDILHISTAQLHQIFEPRCLQDTLLYLLPRKSLQTANDHIESQVLGSQEVLKG